MSPTPTLIGFFKSLRTQMVSKNISSLQVINDDVEYDASFIEKQNKYFSLDESQGNRLISYISNKCFNSNNLIDSRLSLEEIDEIIFKLNTGVSCDSCDDFSWPNNVGVSGANDGLATYFQAKGMIYTDELVKKMRAGQSFFDAVTSLDNQVIPNDDHNRPVIIKEPVACNLDNSKLVNDWDLCNNVKKRIILVYDSSDKAFLNSCMALHVELKKDYPDAFITVVSSKKEFDSAIREAEEDEAVLLHYIGHTGVGRYVLEEGNVDRFYTWSGIRLLETELRQYVNEVNDWGASSVLIINDCCLSNVFLD